MELKLQQACHLNVFVKDVTCVGELGVELHDEIAVDSLWIELSYEVAGCLHSATCCQQIVVKEHHVIGRDGVFVYFYRIDAVLFGIALLYGVAWQLAWFAAQYDAGVQPDGSCGAHDKAATLDAHDFCDAFILVEIVHHVTDDLDTFRILEKGSYVAEVDAFNRLVRNAS